MEIKLLISVLLMLISFISIDNNIEYNHNNFIVNENSENDENYIDYEAFDYIRKCYNNIDFFSDFNTCDSSVNEYYKKQYLRLLDCEVKFKVKETDEEYYVNQYSEMNCGDEYDKKDYVYYYFDADNDSLPELCITDETRFIYIMKYNSDSDEFVLWHEVPTTWIRLLGSRKLWLYSGTSPIKYAFYQLDQNGDTECTVMFYIEERYKQESNETETVYMLTLPEFSNGREGSIPENVKKQSAQKDSHSYYRVTEEQWNELTENFFEEKEASKEKIIEVRFTYDELFSE